MHVFILIDTGFLESNLSIVLVMFPCSPWHFAGKRGNKYLISAQEKFLGPVQ